MKIFLSNYSNILFGFCLILLISVSACSDHDTKVDDCPITVDTVAIIDIKNIGDSSYYLVHRVSGWQDKVEILELYDEEPIFDHCSKASVGPIDGDSLEMSKSISHVFLNIKERKLYIVYKDGFPMKNQNNSIKLEIK